MTPRPSRKATAILVAAATLLAAALSGLALMLHWGEVACSPPMQPLQPGKEQLYAPSGNDPSNIDWGYWQNVNPDVVGWIIVPRTGVSQPVVQARRDNPTFYLSHDVYGNWNPFGAVYLDASIEGLGFSAPNVLILGHNVSGPASGMFAELTQYANEDFAASHRSVLILTPEGRHRFEVFASDVVDARETDALTAFASHDVFTAYVDACVQSANVLLEAPQAPERIMTLATCSYSQWEDERTLVFAAPSQPNTV